ncbi:hypothetical protein BVE84_08630 [Streptococcus azizii]|uniref:Uncharacterized protein n=1 Tax=Streptococcus azizii TaxID=1579424 RepID=A0AB36JKE7_9STRE|nr:MULTISPECIES: hypothetical protein [Streptococcus]MBF0776661.1 hypothetical protein [Streptococcus sp. 19428wD3_AN2]ONK25879.1 hypothetical protein BVE86_08880 [Streptococcus azizii]ONK26265.1 hypothetical protein BVE85_08725 [Streptococcus azizii]ONK27043.1 hypothetical protein BVE84_08630 [Streptococcus azizii]TFU82611.1 hypothetical protein E4T83_07905 [Streptococcus sp. AN2]
MKTINYLAVIVAVISILIPILYVLDDINILKIQFPIHPMYLSFICLVVIAFLEILERNYNG